MDNSTAEFKNATVAFVVILPLLLALVSLARNEKILRARANTSRPPAPTCPECKKMDQPPIIQLSETAGYSFDVGKATIPDALRARLDGEIVPRLVKIVAQYGCHNIDVIGHTDSQPFSGSRSNLDLQTTTPQSDSDGALVASSNAELGLLRAWAVIRQLQGRSELTGIRFTGYSGGSWIRPDGSPVRPGDAPKDPSRRRIELRVRCDASGT